MKAKKRVLIVDDEPDLRDVVAFNLTAAGYDAVAVGSAEEALALPLARFDLVLLDVMMPGMSGFELARQLKASAETAICPRLRKKIGRYAANVQTRLGFGYLFEA